MKKQGQVGIVTCGHPARKYMANGKCGPCYEREWMEKHGLNRREYFWERNLKYRFGMSRADYEALLTKQQGGCAICKSPTPQRKGSERLYVDHRHTTKTVRGLLCHQCNRVLGIFKDDPQLFDTAAAYLRRTE